MQDDNKDAEEAARKLLLWIGENPEREGLSETPARFARAWRYWCGGYEIDPEKELNKTFVEIGTYDEMITLTDIRFVSHCEHHLAPIIGVAHIGYVPRGAVVGISKLARLVDIYARRLQVQEKMTAEIASCMESQLNPRGIAVVVEAEHLCLTSRGINKPGSTMVTSKMLGLFREDPRTRGEFLQIISKNARS